MSNIIISKVDLQAIRKSMRAETLRLAPKVKTGKSSQAMRPSKPKSSTRPLSRAKRSGSR